MVVVWDSFDRGTPNDPDQKPAAEEFSQLGPIRFEFGNVNVNSILFPAESSREIGGRKRIPREIRTGNSGRRQDGRAAGLVVITTFDRLDRSLALFVELGDRDQMILVNLDITFDIVEVEAEVFRPLGEIRKQIGA